MSDLLISSADPRPQDSFDSRGRSEPELDSTLNSVSYLSGGADVESANDEQRVGAEDVEGLPIALVQVYADIAVRHAVVREVDPDVFVATVAGLEGPWGDGDDEAEALQELREAIIGWVAVKRRVGATDVPPMEGIDLNPRS